MRYIFLFFIRTRYLLIFMGNNYL